MNTFSQDLKFGIRTHLRSPGLFLVVVLTLGLGIGANTAIFSAVNALLLRPLPVADADRLVNGSAMREGFDPFGASALEYLAFRERSRSFVGMGIGRPRNFNLLDDGEPERVEGAAVTADYLATLGVKPVVGRIFSPEEDRPGAPETTLIGFGLWQRRFGGDPGLLGRSLVVEGRPHVVIGILPPGFDLPFAAEVWVPLRENLHALPLDQRSSHGYEFIARLKPGVAVERGDAELKALSDEVAREFPQTNRGWSFKLISLRRHVVGDLDGRVHQALFALAGAVGFLLLLCCANVASLLSAQGVTREGELAVRRVLGASDGRIVRQMLTESLVPAFCGGLLGLTLAYWTLPVLKTLNPIQSVTFSAFLRDLRLDRPTLGFTLAVTLATAVLSGVIPAFKALGTRDMQATMKRSERRAGGGGRRGRLGALVVIELAIAVTLLVGGGLLIQSFRRLQGIDLGFRPENRLKARLALSPDRYRNRQERMAHIERILERVRALPGVVSVGMSTNLPMDLGSSDSLFLVEGRPPANPSQVPITALRLTAGEYLETLGATLIAGRLLSPADRADSLPVVVISEELARQAWPEGGNPLGKRLRRGRPDQTDRPWLTVVGVVKDVKEDRFNFRINRPAWYLPHAQVDSTAAVNLLVKTVGNPSDAAAAVRSVIRSVDPRQPVAEMETLEDHLADVLATERFGAVLMGTLAAVGLVLATTGLFSVLAWSVTRRTGEIGLRMALGARPRDILLLILGDASRLIVLGLSVGLTGAVFLSRFLVDVLYGVKPGDPQPFLVTVALLVVAAVPACLIPAWRAMKVAPMTALRNE